MTKEKIEKLEAFLNDSSLYTNVHPEKRIKAVNRIWYYVANPDIEIPVEDTEEQTYFNIAKRFLDSNV